MSMFNPNSAKQAERVFIPSKKRILECSKGCEKNNLRKKGIKQRTQSRKFSGLRSFAGNKSE